MYVGHVSVLCRLASARLLFGRLKIRNKIGNAKLYLKTGKAHAVSRGRLVSDFVFARAGRMRGFLASL
jgi:hypothetical protein